MSGSTKEVLKLPEGLQLGSQAFAEVCRASSSPQGRKTVCASGLRIAAARPGAEDTHHEPPLERSGRGRKASPEGWRRPVKELPLGYCWERWIGGVSASRRADASSPVAGPEKW
jgi:hypothetical protein